MRYWIRVYSEAIKCSSKKWERERTQRESGEVKTEAEIGGMCVQAKKHQGLLATPRNQKRDTEEILPQNFQKEPTLPSKTLKKYISVGLSHSVSGNL